MQIILVRHGRSAHIHSGWLDHHGVAASLRAYDAAGLAPGEQPPPALRALAASGGIVATSDMPRALESGALLAAGRATLQSALLRETSLPIPALARIRLPITAWGLMIGFNWMRAIAREREQGE